MAEFGAGNQPLDMIAYQKGGQEYLLMSNSARGVMKIDTAPFATAQHIGAKVTAETGGVPFEKIASMTGVEQLDLLDADRSVVIARGAGWALALGGGSAVVVRPGQRGSDSSRGQRHDAFVGTTAFCRRIDEPDSRGRRSRTRPPGRLFGPADALAISLVTPDAGSARIQVSGLSTAEASALAAATLDAAAWHAILRVTSGADDSVPVAGKYAVVGTTVEFVPAFPFDPGHQYDVRFDPARLPVPRSDAVVVARVGLPAKAESAPVEVAAIYPTSDEWPANLLRFYVHFSGPMARETGVGRVHIVDDSGKELADALLPSPVDFWSPDQTRYTVFFEPGRVKRGIKPNLDEGRALVPGKTYSVVVDAAWPDTLGRSLLKSYRRTFRVVPAREAPLSLEDWRLSSPAVGSREPLVVQTLAPLDRALLMRTVGVALGGRSLDGAVEVGKNETEWRFTPAAPWARADHQLVVLSSLEDPSGNRIGRAFEVLPTDPAANAEAPERFTLPIALR